MALTELVTAQMAAAVAFGLAALATGWAEKEIGPAAVGAIVEKPESFGKALIMVVIPETILIFGLVMGLMLIG